MIQLATQSSTAASCVQSAKTRLVETLSVDPAYIRVVARPSPDYADYKAEEGIALILQAPEPKPLSGAGRHGYLTNRVLEVHVCTENLSDAAGSDELACYAHWTLEEAVVDTLLDTRSPTLRSTAEFIGLGKMKWIPGGAQIERMVKTDPGLLFSVLLFQVEYVPTIRVDRS